MHLNIGNTRISVSRKDEPKPRFKDAARWLMPVPKSRTFSDEKLARTYGLRGQYVLVYNEDGDVWMGPALRETIYRLANFGYTNKNHWVPLRGEGQRVAGDPIVVDGFTINVYPEWIGRKSLPEDLEFWALLEKDRIRFYADGRSVENAFRQLTLLPFER